MKKILDTLKKDLIKFAFTESDELLNIQGAKIHLHEIAAMINRTSEDLLRGKILFTMKEIIIPKFGEQWPMFNRLASSPTSRRLLF